MAVSSCPITPEASPTSKKSPLGILVSLSKFFTKIQSHPERQLLCFCVCALGGVTVEKPRMDLDEAHTGISGKQSKIYSFPDSDRAGRARGPGADMTLILCPVDLGSTDLA